MERDWIERDWIERDWTERDWRGRDWGERDGGKRDWIERDWIERDWTVTRVRFDGQWVDRKRVWPHFMFDFMNGSIGWKRNWPTHVRFHGNTGSVLYGIGPPMFGRKRDWPS